MRCAQDSRGIASRPPKSSGAKRAGKTRSPGGGQHQLDEFGFELRFLLFVVFFAPDALVAAAAVLAWSSKRKSARVPLMCAST